jgi:tetratricopeptide (TPR) repeat protein
MEKESFERSMRELDKVLDLYIDKYNACKDGDVDTLLFLMYAAGLKGDVLYSQGKIDEAMKCYENSGNFDILMKHYLDVEQYDKAFEYCRKLYEPNDGIDVSYNEFINELVKRKKYEVALSFIEKVFENCKDSFWNYHKAACLCSLDRFEEALPCIDELLIDRREVNILFSKGLILNHLGRNQEALEHFEQCKNGNWANLAQVAIAVCKTDGEKDLNYLLRVLTEEYEANPTQSNLNLLEKCQKVISAILSSYCHFEEAFLDEDTGKELSIKICLDDYIRNTEEWFEKAFCLQSTGRKKEALEYYEDDLVCPQLSLEIYVAKAILLQKIS